MNPDNCPHDFSTLTRKILPDCMKALKSAIHTPWPASLFTTPRVGIRTILRCIGEPSDFQGVYCVLENRRPIYVDTSQTVVKAIRLDLTGGSHPIGTLPFRMARKRSGYIGPGAKALSNPRFKRTFEKVRGELSGMEIACMEVADSVTLHLLKVQVALTYGTGEWNSFPAPPVGT